MPDNSMPVSPNDRGKFRVSPTDVSQFIRLEQCRRYLRLRLHERAHGRAFLTGYGVWPQPIPTLLTRSGNDFEQRTQEAIARALPARDLAAEAEHKPTRRPDNDEVVGLARDLPPGGKLCLFQVRLVVDIGQWAIRGDMDVLRMERDEQGSLDLWIADMKSSAAARVEHRLQVAFYHAMLAALLDGAGVPYEAIRPAILYRGVEAQDDARASRQEIEERARQRAEALALFSVDDGLLEMVPDSEAYLDAVRDLVTGKESTAAQAIAMPFEEVPYHLTFKCDGCLYNEHCMKWSAERDDLSLVPHLTALDKDVLRRAGVCTVHDLAVLKEFRTATRLGRTTTELVAAPGKEDLVRKLSATWPVGPRLDELVYRARYYRARWKKDPIDYRPNLPAKGHGSLPYCDAEHNPNLVRIYIDAQPDYLHGRLYMLSSLVVAAEGGVVAPHRRRTIVHLSDGPPDTEAKEEDLLVRWVRDTLQAAVELAADDAEGKKNAPVHLIFFNSYEQRVLLDALGRHLQSVLGATPVYDFMTQLAAFDSPLVTFMDAEIRELRNYPMVCQSLQAVSAFLKFDWRQGPNYREIFKEGLFDFWGKLDEASVPEGESPWFTSRARFKSDIPLEYAYAAWGELPDPPPGDLVDELAPYRRATVDLLRGFEELRLHALERIVGDFEGNRLTQKTPFTLPDLSAFEEKATSLAQALREFVTIERHVDLAGWKAVRNIAPERRVLMGETLVVRYLEAEQDPETVERNREAERRRKLREQYEAEYLSSHPGATKAVLTKEQRKETEWSLERLRFALRMEMAGIDASVEEALGLTTLREGDRVVLFPRFTVDSRLPVEQQTQNTPTPKQMLYGMRVEIAGVRPDPDESGKVRAATVEVVVPSQFNARLKGFVFPSAHRLPLADGELYTLDSDPNDIYGYWCSVVADGLCSLAGVQNAVDSEGPRNALYERIAEPCNLQVRWGGVEQEAQQRFLQGLAALQEVNSLEGFEPSKLNYIGGHGADPVLLVQGPPGTGKSYSTAFAVFARLQGAMAAGRDFRVFLSCKTHAATDVLLEKILHLQRNMLGYKEHHPDLWARYFDDRLLEVPLFRMAPRQTPPEGIIALAREAEKAKGDRPGADIISGLRWCVVAATPGGVYGLVKEKWGTKDLFGHYFCDCLVLDEASQMNLPEATMAALPLQPEGQLIVVGDPRQMPPIVKHDWANERRRTFQEYKSYRSLFDTLLELDPRPPMIQFAESFRLHADIAEFLRREIYSRDGIAFHSERHTLLQQRELEDDFVAAVLSPEHPLVVVVHEEAHSQVRNVYEQQLIKPVLEALSRPDVYNLDPLDGLGVVVPHRAQRADMQTGLPMLSRRDPETQAVLVSAVDTVERFQGGERAVIVVSATESDRDYLLASSDFLYDPRRLTVAISRAKEKMVLVASRTIFSLFSPDQDAFANAQLWKNLLRRTSTALLWQGERAGVGVEVWGNE